MTIQLSLLDSCFHGFVPGVVATCDADGMPNVSYISHVQLVDDDHVALSCQFFNKTRQNLDANPLATLELYEPTTFQAYRLRLRFLRSETEGPVFDAMSSRIQTIASHCGMAGVFKLRSADVCEVLSIEARTGFLEPIVAPEPPTMRDGPLTELRGLQLVSARIARARDLESLLGGALSALDEVFGFTHGMILVPDDSGTRLVAIAAHGYGNSAIGAEVAMGEGLVGSVAQGRHLVRIASVSSELRYGRAIRAEYQEHRQTAVALAAEIPLPRLADAESQMAIPLLVQNRLVGVLALECKDSLTFAQWHEAFLQVLANQIAAGIDRMMEPATSHADEPDAKLARTRSFTLYRNDDCVFVDGEYLIRNVPGKILWKVLRAYQSEGRTDFSNRELRLDPALGLPAFKDNLESRLILLRKRLEQKCADVRIVPTKRGRFALELDCNVELVERETA